MTHCRKAIKRNRKIMKRTLLFFFWTILLSSCITIEDEADILIDEYIVFQDDTIFVNQIDTIKIINYGQSKTI